MSCPPWFAEMLPTARPLRLSGDIAKPDGPAPGHAGDLPAVAGEYRPGLPCDSPQASVLKRVFEFKLTLGIDPAEFAKRLINQPSGKNVKVALDFFKPTVPNLEQLLKNIDNNQQLIRIQGQTK